MENKINIAELLKDCPQGMELDCILYDNIYFDTVEHNSIKCYIQNKGYRTSVTFDVYGGLIYSIPTKCVIFPKGKTTWKGFQRPFKDGDIVATQDGIWIGIHKRMVGNAHEVYLAINHDCLIFKDDIFCFERLATEEEKQKLFDAIKANGYKWNAETKTLEKLIEPKFKVGDGIKYRGGEIVYRIVQITEDSYVLDNLCSIPISIEHMYNLVPNKFDITTLVPFESRVLMRSSNAREWVGTIYSHYNNKFYGCGMCCDQCIPYEGNEHLLGKTDDCDEYFKIWE